MTLSKEIVGDFIDACVEDQPAARQMLEQHPELRRARWIHEETIVHFLTVEGFAEAVRFLAGLGFDVNVPNEFGDTPLVDAAVLGNHEIARILLENGANPNAQSDTNDNVLHSAIRSGNAGLVDLLLSSGARPDYVTYVEETVFDALPEESGPREAILAVFEKYGVQTRPEDPGAPR